MNLTWLLLNNALALGPTFSAALSIPRHHQHALTEVVTLDDGPVQGRARDQSGILSFKSIPFAAPPTNELRWHSPVAPAPWTTPLNATEFGHSCFQASSLVPAPTTEDEDCLTVNVWTGAESADERRPVMVWVNPGGFQFGSSADPTYDGTLLAQRGVVVVSFNYRLGVLGFLAHPDLDGEEGEEGEEGSNSGNFGLQDQQAALKWVQNNIALFGGDPESVTLFGESAGAHATGLLMTSARSKGLFHKAILQSGAWWDTTHGSLTTFSEARARGEDFFARLQAQDVSAARSLPATIVNAAGLWNESLDPALAGFSPNIDQFVLKDNPGTVFQHGEQLHIPLLAGWNEAEGYPFQAQGLDVDAFQEQVTELFGDNATTALTFYPAGTREQTVASAQLLTGDLLISEETWEAAVLQAQVVPNVFAYSFIYTSPFSPVATHTADLAFMFGNLLPNPLFGNQSAPASEEDRVFAEALMTYWTNFAKTGDPNQGSGDSGLPSWPALSRTAGDGLETEVLELGTEIRSTAYDVSRFQFLRSFRQNGVRPYAWRTVNTN